MIVTTPNSAPNFSLPFTIMSENMNLLKIWRKFGSSWGVYLHGTTRKNAYIYVANGIRTRDLHIREIKSGMRLAQHNHWDQLELMSLLQ